MTRRALAALAGAPLLALALCETAPRLYKPPTITDREAKIVAAASSLFADAQNVAKCAVERDLADAAQCAPPELRSRLEGVGVIENGRDYARWSGTPAEPGTLETLPRPQFAIRTTGLRTSLVVASASDAGGRFAIASFLLDSPLADAEFETLLAPSGTLSSADEIRLLPVADDSVDAAAGSRVVPIVAPGGIVVAEALLRDGSVAFARASWRGRGVAAAVAIALVIIAAIGPWRRLVLSGRGLAVVLAAIAIARALLLATHVPERILLRELGSPSLYGSPGLAGLLSSPANLALTTFAVLAAALAIRRHARAAPRVGLGVAFLCAAATAIAAWGLSALAASLARDARVGVLQLAAAAASPGRAALLTGLAAAVVAVAALAGATVHALARGMKRTHAAERPVELLMLAASALLAAYSLQRTADGIALDRLRSEFAPRVLDQSAQRRVALIAAVRAAAQNQSMIAALATGPSAANSAAYRAWIAGPLFHQGFMSSLDLVDSSGAARGHFAFALPPFDEAAPDHNILDGDVEVREETLSLVAVAQSYLHAQATVWRGGSPIGNVVGHVLDGPQNLPFLPSVAPYLAAIGPGAAHAVTAGVPDYVVYDAEGNVVLHTRPNPPAASPAIREAAQRGATIELDATDGRWIGLPLREGSRLHLLLLAARSPFDLLVSAIRLLLVVTLVGGAAIVVVKSAQAGGPAALLAHVRQSFYRKLLAILLLASIAPLVALALVLKGYVERRVEVRFVETNSAVANAVRRVVEDYAAPRGDDADTGAPKLNDAVLSWLRGIVGQEIHLYRDGVLEATSKPELFSSGLLLPRLPGEVQHALIHDGLPYLVRRETLGPTPLPVAYARVDLPGPGASAIVAVPLVVQQRDIRRAVERVGEMLLLTTVVLTILLSIAAAYVARSVARPVRALAAATERIARGDYATRLSLKSRDEIGALVGGFNSMAESLAEQRTDLERRRDYMEALLANATTGVVSTDAAGRIVTVNAAAEALIGAVGGVLDPGGDLLTSVSRLAPLSVLAEFLKRPVPPRPVPEQIDLVVAGSARRLRLVRAALPDPLGGPPGVLYLVDDVTDLMRSNQLAAWAEMARAIAHEIKNPLTPIQLSTEHLQRLLRDRRVLPSPELDLCLDTVLKQVRALREIATEFAAYSRLPSLQLEPLDPVGFIRDVTAAYRSALPVGITLREDYREAPVVAIDRRVLARAIVNLVENALQAMPSGGTLTLACGPANDGGTMFGVSDTGSGLAPEVRARLFEPYFSTKSSGTGLGLAIVRRAVEAHGGRVEYDSAPGVGTTFIVHLPPLTGREIVG